MKRDLQYRGMRDDRLLSFELEQDDPITWYRHGWSELPTKLNMSVCGRSGI